MSNDPNKKAIEAVETLYKAISHGAKTRQINDAYSILRTFCHMAELPSGTLTTPKPTPQPTPEPKAPETPPPAPSEAEKPGSGDQNDNLASDGEAPTPEKPENDEKNNPPDGGSGDI